ncbi:hypothetical protein [uncultured Psychroserpens sp.]|uniref:hypothetical protein n=1 Tax=uncultured Psychroserpens sp. TaxID=255436 RepID=UPI00262EDEF1|nr:hypothetical protein [uncultured Psychroserpens sp.]
MKNVLITMFLVVTSLSCSGQLNVKELSKTYNVITKKECDNNNGYWYNNKCWANFEDEGISKKDIDGVAKEQFKLIKNTKIKINEKNYPIIFFMPEEDGNELFLITVFKEGDNEKTLLQIAENVSIFNDKNFETHGLIFNGNLVKLSEEESPILEDLYNNPKAIGNINVIVNDIEELDVSFKGNLNDVTSDSTYDISFTTNEAIMGAGDSTIEIKDNEAHINGTLGTLTFIQLKDVIKNHPNIKTLVLGNISGSVNDEVNMHTGRLVREHGFTTKVLSNSVIASGGVDLFCAGKERIVNKGAKIGVHSWGAGAYTATDIPKDHPAHQYQIEFFTMCMGKEDGPEFYFYTLDSASFDDIHWMSDNEIKKRKVATKFIN